jgi:hypothetical protein
LPDAEEDSDSGLRTMLVFTSTFPTLLSMLVWPCAGHLLLFLLVLIKSYVNKAFVHFSIEMCFMSNKQNT